VRKVLLVLVREYLENVRTKAFLIAVLMTPLLVGLSLLLPRWAAGQEVRQRKIAVADLTGAVLPRFVSEVAAKKGADGSPRYRVEEVPLSGTPAEREAALEGLQAGLDARVKSEDLFAWVVIRSGALEKRAGGAESEMRTGNVGDFTVLGDLRDALDTAANAEIGRRKNVDEETARLLSTRVVLRPQSVTAKDRAGTAAQTIAPLALLVVLFLTIVGTSQALITSTLEEKANRVVEVLLSSVSPFQLMAGKVLGVCAVGLTLMTIWGGAGVITLAAQGFLPALAGRTLPLALLYYFLGFLLIASVMVAVGSACNTLKEAQNLLSPVMILITLPMLMIPFVMKDPNGPTAAWLSFFPLFTPFLMMMRIAQSIPPPAWQIVASLLLLAASTAVAVWLASRVFRVGILLYGKPPTLREIVRWVRSGA
jgi:ABC-2 type transport system permease protein